MKRSANRYWAQLLLLPALALWGCAGENTGDPCVEISGPVALQIGETISLSARTLNETDSGYTWASQNDEIATVDDRGNVTGTARGETVITATGRDSGVTARHGVVVLREQEAGAAVVIVTIPQVMVEVGSTLQAQATTVNGDDDAYTWESSNVDVATVSASGIITGVARGETVITAVGNQTAVDGQVGVLVVPAGGGGEVPGEIPQLSEWQDSPHSDATAEAFTHWDAEGEVPTSCARCHSSEGYVDYVEDGVVDNAAPTGSVVRCETCHDPAAQSLTEVTFPSGVTLSDLGTGTRCQVCHQGRASTQSVLDLIATAEEFDEATGTIDPDVVLTTLDTSGQPQGVGFVNIHYKAAGATLNGTLVQGAYEYDGQMYDARFQHVLGLNECASCHNPHSTEVRLELCADCHSGVSTVEDLRSIRMIQSRAFDFDGDGDRGEGIAQELETLQDRLLESIQRYASTTAGVDPVCYDAHAYPYFFQDTDASGACEEAEVDFGNRVQTWTPRLMKAAYNYQFAAKDGGAFAHNAKYLIELLVDSIRDLSDDPGEVGELARQDPGHFNGSSEAFRHWDEDDPPVVPASCSRCHGGAEGFRFYLEHGVGNNLGAEIPVTRVNGLDCTTCHTDDATYQGGDTAPILALDEFVFEASEVVIDDYTPAGNICATCHQGRSSKATVDARATPGFVNVHYLPAAATLFGSVAQVGYEFDGQLYAGRETHPAGIGCTDCHEPEDSQHSFHVSEPEVFAGCQQCHGGVTEVSGIRLSSTTDVDGDGDNTEPLVDELTVLHDALLVALQGYASQTLGSGICYAHRYPYFFVDEDGDGACADTETTAYAGWDETLMRAAYNYQYGEVEPGAWAHNFNYMAQLLYDSIAATGGDVSTFNRPAPAQ